MLKVQPSSIALGSFGSSSVLTLTNPGDKYVIFKAKTTNNEVMTAKPNIGVIPPQEKSEIVIKTFSQKRLSAKILISSASIDLPSPQQHISDIWRQISSSAIQRHIVEVKKESELALIEEEEHEMHRGSSAIQKSEEPKKLKKPTNQEYEKLYIDQLNYNNRLSQQVQTSQKALATKLREEYEKRIISLFPSQEGLYINLTYTELVLGVLLAFFVGYILGKL